MIRFQNLALKIPTILQHMIPNPKPKTMMTQPTFIHLCWNNSILVKLNLHHLEMFIIICFQFFLHQNIFYKNFKGNLPNMTQNLIWLQKYTQTWIKCKSNPKVLRNYSQPFVNKQKDRTHVYEYNPAKSSEILLSLLDNVHESRLV